MGKGLEERARPRGRALSPVGQSRHRDAIDSKKFELTGTWSEGGLTFAFGWAADARRS